MLTTFFVSIDHFAKVYLLSHNASALQRNEAFLFLFHPQPLILWISASSAFVILFIIFIHELRAKSNKMIPLVIILIGATGNLLDRALYGGVIDYIHIGNLISLNGADIIIMTGLIATILL